MYYTGGNGEFIQRYDVTRHVQLANFARLPGPGFANEFRLLPDGGALVAAQDNVIRLNDRGEVVQTYEDHGRFPWNAVDLDPDGKSFWAGTRPVASNSELFKFDLSTGVVASTVDTGVGLDAMSLTIFQGSRITECADGIDNDGNGFVDLQDIGCIDAADSSEFSPDPTLWQCRAGPELALVIPLFMLSRLRSKLPK